MHNGYMKPDYREGQRWVSESEPELGVGVVVGVDATRVSLLFSASGTLRQYALGSAPIKRVKFVAGDTIVVHTGESLVVDSVESREGVLHYQCGARGVPETDLSETLSFSKPEERLVAGYVDAPEVFDLRLECLRRRHQVRHSPVRGFLGGRIDLIPHQLSIAHEVASRLLPRVLLADEVGLGKTIEACLILHRLFRSGRASRILILVPEPLVNQWFVELLRRFSMRVAVFDEERCLAIEAGEEGANPFLDDQVILCPMGLLASNAVRAEQAVAAGWDLVIVDEVHHLRWSQEEVSPEYSVVEALAVPSPGLILLTATPEQLGVEGHFARLRLLDPDRYSDFETFQGERKTYQQSARIAAKLLESSRLTVSDKRALRTICNADPERLESQLVEVEAGDESSRQSLLEELVDQHGPGRVMFRNVRSTMQGFPERQAHLYPLEGDSCANELPMDDGESPRHYDLKGDARVGWLLNFLRNPRKVLLICRTREKVLELESVLRSRVNLNMALFHEDLTLLQRDRNAAWFAAPEGAQILICSELGSEGRNFQFAHDLVLFDLPPHPDLLEQRIGRLDRIGQKETISIHVPYVKGQPMEILARWYHEGLDAFEKSPAAGNEVIERLREKLEGFLARPQGRGFAEFLEDTRSLHKTLGDALEAGQDRLLQMNSCRPEVAKRLIEQIRTYDQDPSLNDFVLRLMDHRGVHVEQLDPSTWLARPQTSAFPELPDEGLTWTCDRKTALAREDIAFLTWDHPMVTGGIDLLLGSLEGVCSFAVWPDAPASGIFLECIHVLEPVAPAALHVDRFLPATPIRVVVDVTGKNVTASLTPEALVSGSVFPILDRLKNKTLPHMLEKNRLLAVERARIIAEQAGSKMRSTLGTEIQRLRDLEKINDHIREEEITTLQQHLEDVAGRIASAPIRLDSLRLIVGINPHLSQTA